MKSPDELTEAFRDRGLRVTPQRQAIFRVLHGSDRHPTAEWVFDAVRRDLPTISLKTVYQALNDLATTFKETTATDVVNGSANWIKTKADQVAALTKACTSTGN